MHAPATLGWRAYPASVRRSTSSPSPSADSPQPVPWVMAMTPSTPGWPSSAPGAENAWAIRRTTVAEQLTELITAM